MGNTVLRALHRIYATAWTLLVRVSWTCFLCGSVICSVSVGTAVVPSLALHQTLPNTAIPRLAEIGVIIVLTPLIVVAAAAMAFVSLVFIYCVLHAIVTRNISAGGRQVVRVVKTIHTGPGQIAA